MLDLSKALKVYINGKLVKDITFNEEFSIYEDDPYLTIMDDYSVTVRKGAIIENYKFSYTASPDTPNFLYGLYFEDEGERYFLTMVEEKDKGVLQIYDTDYISSGWYSDVNQSGEEYSMWIGHYIRNITNEWYFGFDIENRLATYPIDEDMLDEAIKRANKTFPTAHIKRVASADNYFEMDDYEDTWLALCTSWTNKVRIQFNYSEMTSYYGAFTTDKTTDAYKKWLGTAVHELGHTFGPPDQASHLPSIYDYSRDRTKALYLQQNDIVWIKHAYCDLYGCDPSIFDVDRTVAVNSNADVPVKAKVKSRLMAAPQGDDGEMCLNFDYGSFDSTDDLEAHSTNIVTATLTYNRTEKLNIGRDLELNFDIYTINVIDEEKGTLTKKELKIHPQENNIKENTQYKLYLKEYTKTPCSLVNVHTGLIEL